MSRKGRGASGGPAPTLPEAVVKGCGHVCTYKMETFDPSIGRNIFESSKCCRCFLEQEKRNVHGDATWTTQHTYCQPARGQKATR